MLKKRKGIVADYLPWVLIAVAVLAIVLIAIFVLKDEGIGLIEKIKSLFKS